MHFYHCYHLLRVFADVVAAVAVAVAVVIIWYVLVTRLKKLVLTLQFQR